jgi:hypothetical protein
MISSNFVGWFGSFEDFVYVASCAVKLACQIGGVRHEAATSRELFDAIDRWNLSSAAAPEG